MKIRVSINIEAPPRAVWDSIADISTHVEWMADARSIEFLTVKQHGVGTEFICVTAVGPLRTRDHMTVTEWSPNAVMGIEHVGLFRGNGRFTLRKARHGCTRFVWKERLYFPWWMAGPVGALLAKPILRFIWKRNLQRLKALIEGTSGQHR